MIQVLDMAINVFQKDGGIKKKQNELLVNAKSI